jgi:hypothetical protein
MNINRVWVCGAAAVLACGVEAAQPIADFETKPAWAVYEGDKFGGALECAAAPAEPRGQSGRVTWTALPKRNMLDIGIEESARPVLHPDGAAAPIDGAIRLAVYSEKGDVVRRVEVRLKDRQGESFSWGSDVTLEPGKWTEVAIPIREGTESYKRADVPDKADGKVTAPAVLAAVKLMVKTTSPQGCVYLDDVRYEPAPAAPPATPAP